MHFVCSLGEHQGLRTVALPGDDLPERIWTGIRLPPLRCFGATGWDEVLLCAAMASRWRGEINRAFPMKERKS